MSKMTRMQFLEELSAFIDGEETQLTHEQIAEYLLTHKNEMQTWERFMVQRALLQNKNGSDQTLLDRVRAGIAELPPWDNLDECALVDEPKSTAAGDETKPSE